VAELVDALASGASIGNDVEVRVLSWAPSFPLKNHTVVTPVYWRDGFVARNGDDWAIHRDIDLYDLPLAK
jgi:hypothetical protein